MSSDQTTIPPGQPVASVLDVAPGDFFLSRGHSWVNKIIRFGEWVAAPGLFWQGLDPYSYYDHAGLFCCPDGGITEALGSGVVHGNIRRYDPEWVTVVRIAADLHDRQQMVAFAHAQHGSRYGWATIAAIACTTLTRQKFIFQKDGSVICSGLVGAALTRGDYIWDRSPPHLKPSDLATYFDVRRPVDSSRPSGS